MGRLTPIRALAILLFLPFFAFAQPRPAFEVASVRPYQDGAPRTNDITPGTVNRRGVRLVDYIAWAYNVQDFEISGPGWMSDLRFDILAKAATPAPVAEMRLMMQTLLADRFKLTLHREQRDMPALVLTLGKSTHKLVENNTPGSPDFSNHALDLTGNGATINQMTGFLMRQLHLLVVDRTGLTGRYNYHLDISSFMTDEVRRRNSAIEMPGIVAAAIQEQLGLKVESAKIPRETIVVDGVEKVPAAN
jgi:uncharacterized protein (TIGR03435 family)